MGEKMIFYNLEQFRLIANSFESKTFFMMDDTMFSVLSGTIFKTNDWGKLISSSGNNFILRSSKCKFSYLDNDSSRCKDCKPLIKKMFTII